jgi:subtilisin
MPHIDSARLIATTVAGLVCVMASLAAPVIAGAERRAERPETVPGRFIVLYDSSVEKGEVGEETRRLERSEDFESDLRYRHAVKGFAARLSRADVRALRDDPEVALVAPDRRVTARDDVPLADGEPLAPPGIRRIRAATASTGRQSSSVSVAVLDTGIDLDHPDLASAHGKNCVTPLFQAADDNGHGTHVAGTIAARNDGAGVMGVAPGTTVYSVKVLNASGVGLTSQIICGIDWVTANKSSLNLKVANMSLGGPGSNDANCGRTDGEPEHQAICRSTQAGVTYVVAAGNDGWDIGDDPEDTPAAYPEVLTVAAMADSDGLGGATGPVPSCREGESDDRYASFSNYATRVADKVHMIAAPGVCVRSTWRGDGYATISGTSMASPHVAGAVALCLGEGGAAGPCAGRTPAQIVQHMRSEAYYYRSTHPSYGYAGDPSQPSSGGEYFGYLVRGDPSLDAPVTATPTAAVVVSGTYRSGSASYLAWDDNRYYAVNSTTAGTRIASWYGKIPGVPNSLRSLAATYRGKNSRSCSQRVYAYRWTTGTWVQLDSRAVGTAEVTVTRTPSGSPADYVSGTSGNGQVWLRVTCSSASGSFTSSGEQMRVQYQR